MKKMLSMLSLAAIMAVGAVAASPSSMSYGVKVGGLYDEVKAGGNTEENWGGVIGFEVEKSCFFFEKGKIAAGVDMAMTEDYEVYTIGASYKYPVMKDVKVVGGVSYNWYEFDADASSRGVGYSAGLEYDLSKNVALYSSYKYVDLNNDIKDSNSVVLGLAYKF